MRIGFGYDIHALVTGRPLRLGGLQIPFDQGLEGHSDADVLCHAISDALLGAAALGDIGLFFPDTDPAFKNADSVELMKRVAEKIRETGYRIANIDTTIIAERPKIQPYREAIILNIAHALNLKNDQVSVKATTHEKFDATGQGLAISAYAVVLLFAE